MRLSFLQPYIALGVILWAGARGLGALRCVEAPSLRAARLWISGGGCLCGASIYLTGSAHFLLSLAGYGLALACVGRGLYITFQSSLHNTTM